MSMGWGHRPEGQGSFRERALAKHFSARHGLAVAVAVASCAAIVTSCGGDSGTGPPSEKAPPTVVRIVFTKIVDSVEIGRTNTIAATCVDSVGVQVTGCALKWTSNDTTTATISDAGVVTGAHVGSTTISAAIASGVTGQLRLVVIPPAVASMTFPATSFTLNEGDSVAIPAPTIKDRTGAVVTNRTPAYRSTSSNLSVSATGVVTALSAGAGSIIATLDSVNVTLSFDVVAAPVSAVKLVPSVLDMGVGHTIATQSSAYRADGRKLTGRTYTYSVDNRSVATVSRTGIVTGVAPGSATLTVSTGAGSVTAPISVAQLVPGGFVIDLRFVGNVSQPVQQAAHQAVSVWEKIISAPLIPYHIITNAGDCGPRVPAVDTTETSLLVIVQEDSIDGPSNTVGEGGPCVLRDDAPQLTALGTVLIDKADETSLSQQGLLVATVTHEIGHILGIGTLWGQADLPGFVNLATGLGGSDPVFTGPKARAAAFDLGFTTDSTLGVPIENQGTAGDGTRDAHWRASVFGHELMTGTIHSGLDPISLVTIQALGDFGYAVVPDAADDFDVLNATNPGGYVTPSLSIGTRVRETILFPRFTTSREGILTRIPNARQPQKQ